MVETLPPDVRIPTALRPELPQGSASLPGNRRQVGAIALTGPPLAGRLASVFDAFQGPWGLERWIGCAAASMGIEHDQLTAQPGP